MGVGWGALGPVHDDCHPPQCVNIQAHVPGSSARAPELSQPWHLVRQGQGLGWSGYVLRFSALPPNSMLLFEKPRSLTEPWFPVCSVWRGVWWQYSG